jgi:hypothetical protein
MPAIESGGSHGDGTQHANTIRTFALVCVAVTSAYLIWLSWSLVSIISGPNWCNRAIGAANAAERPEFAVRGCFELLNKQVWALSLSLWISIGILALCLLVLNVIVLAGGRLSFTANAKGVSADVGREQLPDRARGALESAEAAEERADEIVREETAGAPPGKPKPAVDPENA